MFVNKKIQAVKIFVAREVGDGFMFRATSFFNLLNCLTVNFFSECAYKNSFGFFIAKAKIISASRAGERTLDFFIIFVAQIRDCLIVMRLLYHKPQYRSFCDKKRPVNC